MDESDRMEGEKRGRIELGKEEEAEGLMETRERVMNTKGKS